MIVVRLSTFDTCMRHAVPVKCLHAGHKSGLYRTGMFSYSMVLVFFISSSPFASIPHSTPQRRLTLVANVQANRSFHSHLDRLFCRTFDAFFCLLLEQRLNIEQDFILSIHRIPLNTHDLAVCGSLHFSACTLLRSPSKKSRAFRQDLRKVPTYLDSN